MPMWCLREMVPRDENKKYLNACDILGSTWSSPSYLKKHMLKHSDQRPFQCNRCDKAFKHRGDLRRHEQMHDGIKWYKCKVSANSFGRRVHLNIHIVMHADVKAFKCPTCQRAFCCKADVKKHEKRFGSRCVSQTCGICRLQFLDYDLYQKHMVRNAGRPTFSCDRCDGVHHSDEMLQKHKANKCRRRKEWPRMIHLSAAVEAFECTSLMTIMCNHSISNPQASQNAFHITNQSIRM